MRALREKYSELKRNNPQRVILFLALSYLLVLFLLFGAITFWLINKFESNSEQTINLITAQALDIKKEQLITKTKTITSLSQTMLQKKESDIKKQTKIEVENIHSIISEIYNTHRDKSQKLLIDEIVGVLKSIKTYDNSYTFLAQPNGLILLHPDKKLVNTQITKDQATEYRVMQKVLEIKNTLGDGYFVERYYKPNSTILTEKIYYLKQFEPLNILIINGQYRDDIEQKAQHELLDILKNQQENSKDIYLNLFKPTPNGLESVDIANHKDKSSLSQKVRSSIKKQIEKNIQNKNYSGYFKNITKEGVHLVTSYDSIYEKGFIVSNTEVLNPILDEIKNKIDSEDSNLSSEIVGILNMFIIFLFVTSILSITIIKTVKEIFSKKNIELERKNQELQDTNQELMRIFDNSTNPIAIINRDGFLSYANDAFYKTSEYSSSDIGSLNAMMLIRKEFKKQFFSKLEKAQNIGYAEEFSAIIFSKSTNSIHVKISLTRFSKDSFVMMLRDITAELMHTQNLERTIKEEIEKSAQSELKFATLFDNAPAGILIVDSNRCIVKTNKAFENISGYKKEKLEQKKIEEFFLDEYKEQIVNTLRDSDNKDSIRHSYEWKLIDSSGHIKDISALLEVVYRKDESFKFMIVTDITELKKAREKEKSQEKLLIQQSRFAVMGEMINMIAHQWRQPLGALSIEIINLVDWLEDSEASSEYVKKWEKKTTSILKHLSQTIDEFRTFFKQDKKKEVFDLADSIENSVELIVATLKFQNVDVKKELDGDIKIFGFQNKLQQAFLNILNNAKDAIAENEVENGEIKITSKKIDDIVHISFEDNAGGIKVVPVSKIFEPYFSTKSKNSSGIGLYMTKVIIDSHMDGELKVSNSKIGARFDIYLPIFKDEENYDS
ncbi:MAG: PAS domain S-box protein [Campylobacterales bacterium]